MQLESARSLKAMFAAKLSTQFGPAVPTTAAVAAKIGAVSMAAQPIARVAPVQRSIALGVAKKGRKEFAVAVRVQRREMLHHPVIEQIRKAAKREVDVRYVGRISKSVVPWYRRRNRPIAPGCSVAHFAVTAGTLGCFVVNAAGELLVLSNNHVLANENRAKNNDDILQPGSYDHGKEPADRVARLTRFVRLSKTKANLVDCATAAVEAAIGTRLSVKGIGKVTSAFAGQIRDGIAVRKLGRTTGLTHGRISAFELDNVVVAYDLGNLQFDDQIEIESTSAGLFSDGGDSGSLIVTADKEGIALLFAGTDQGGSNGHGLTYANPLDTVLKTLGVTLAQ